MSRTLIYRLPLFESYRYSFVYEEHLRPDEIDEEATIYQALTHDRDGRLVKKETYHNGEPATEKTFEFDGEKLVGEREVYTDTGTSSLVKRRETEEGYVKEYYSDGGLEYCEEYRPDENGVIRRYRITGRDGETVREWEAGEDGQILWNEEKGKRTTYQHIRDENGRVIETVIDDGVALQREVLQYNGEKVVKSEVFSGDCLLESWEFEYDEKGRTVRSSFFKEGIPTLETHVRTDPEGAFEVRTQKRLVPYRAGRTAQGDYVTGRIEILHDGDGRISDVMTSGDRYVEQTLGLDLETDGYYFFEYEP